MSNIRVLQYKSGFYNNKTKNILDFYGLNPFTFGVIFWLVFLKLIDEGSHMVMLECPETVNTLLHEFLLWEPEPLPKALPAPLPVAPEENK